ncbi:uncharacterized protein LOC111365746 [Olea europaea var. sylvestris]|uniref:uncharacterized protein LOC111365746 n=1 Tax=Olea europaea var. sylvestris TaxID=158386 RepID=UPI000C1D4A41|nr:uncharacterized protein LOC111365746 [Olea europaea var. sylvestris]
MELDIEEHWFITLRSMGKQRYQIGSIQNTFRNVSLSISLRKNVPLSCRAEHKAYWAMKQLNMDLQTASEKHHLQINKMEEFRNEAYENARIYKEQTKAWHDRHISKKELLPGQQVLLYNSKLHLFSGKLKSRWSRPFTIVKVFPHGVVEVAHDENGTFKVNGQHLEPYVNGEFDNNKNTILLDPT